jgi:hypothetical protein
MEPYPGQDQNELIGRCNIAECQDVLSVCTADGPNAVLVELVDTSTFESVIGACNEHSSKSLVVLQNTVKIVITHNAGRTKPLCIIRLCIINRPFSAKLALTGAASLCVMADKRFALCSMIFQPQIDGNPIR